MKRFLIRICFLGIVTFFVANLIAYLSLKTHANGNFYKPAFIANKDVALYDYVVVGASTGLTTINTALVDSLSGTKGINLAMDDTGISSHYLMLQHFLAEGNTTNTCFLVPAIGGYDDSNTRMSTNDYRFSMFANRSYVSNYFDGFETTTPITRMISNASYIPAGVVAYYNAEIFFSSLYVLLDSNKRNRFDVHGNYTYPNLQNNKTYKKKLDTIQFKNPYLKKLKSLCAENGIQLVYVIPPVADREIYYTSKDTILDYSNVFQKTYYFYDAIHVTKRGRKVVSERLAKDYFLQQ